MVSLVLLAHVWFCLIAFAMPQRWSLQRRAIGALLAMGLIAFATFWVYFGSPALGRIFSILVLVAPAAAAARIWRHRAAPRQDLGQINRLVLPSLLLAVLVLWIGLYPFDWEGSDWTVPARRWRDMAQDNWLSFMVADMVSSGAIVSPMLEEWLSSDRPPLQSGLFLIFNGLIADHAGLTYQTVSSWGQSLVLVPLSILISGASGRSLRGPMLGVIGLSALVVLNTLFVWPKLLAAAYCATYHLLLFDHGRDGSDATHRRVWFDAAAGCSAALALLSHGGAAFALAGSTLACILVRRAASILPVLRIAAASVCVYLPWVLYQRFVDPPGDRLVKWHFAGQIDVTSRSTGQVLIDAYSSIPFSTWIEGRRANIDTMFAGTFRFFSDAIELLIQATNGRHSHLVQPMIESSFFSTAYSLWFFSVVLVAPFLAWAAVRGKPLRPLWPPGLLTAAFISLAIWVMSSFVPGATIVHHGAYFTTLSVHLAVMLLVASVSRLAFAVLAIANIGTCLLLYVFDRGQSLAQMPAAYAAGATLLTAAFLGTCILMRPADPETSLQKDPA